MRRDHVKYALYRWGYLVAMYCGVRAVFNRIRSRKYIDGCQLARLHRTRLRSETLGDLMLFVHARPGPPSFSGKANFGMISVQQRHPKLGALLYWYLCLTSHFGRGQMEIAFYEKQGRVILYALRNTAASNAFRLGWYDISKKLTLAKRDDVAMRVVMQHLERSDFVTRLAAVSECLSLSVSDWLLSPASRLRALGAMKKKYSQLHRTLKAHVA